MASEEELKQQQQQPQEEYDRSKEPIKAIKKKKVRVSVTGVPKIPTKLPLK